MRDLISIHKPGDSVDQTERNWPNSSTRLTLEDSICLMGSGERVESDSCVVGAIRATGRGNSWSQWTSLSKTRKYEQILASY